MKENFYEWLDDFIKRKEIDLNETFDINVDGVNHSFYYQNVIDEIKNANEYEQSEIKKMIIKFDYENENIKDYLKHLAIPLAKQVNTYFCGIENNKTKEQLNKINVKEDIKNLDLLYRKILDMSFNTKSAINMKEIITSEIDKQVDKLIAENKLSNKEYMELIVENKDYKRLEERKEQLAEDRLYMIWENCSYKEIAEILKNNYSYTDEEIIDEFDDEEVREEVKNHLIELKEIEESSKNVILDNEYIFKFENEFYFSKLKDICEHSQDLAGIREGLEIAIITNSDVSKEAFLAKYTNNIEIIYNFYNKTSKEMETYEYEVFDMNEIKSKEELIEKMKEKLEHFEEKYNKLEQDEENIEV